jgi:hypothetical protein
MRFEVLTEVNITTVDFVVEGIFYSVLEVGTSIMLVDINQTTHHCPRSKQS